MTVHFIGAGPGAVDLLTLRARDLIAASPVCLYAGSLVPPEMLEICPPDARTIDTALMTLDEITDEMVRAHRHGLDVARLASGDPSVFSALAEQMRRLEEQGVPYDVCPGVPAYAAAAAALGRELTVPTVAQTVTLTRIAARATPMPDHEGLVALGQAGGTVVLHLAVHRIDEVVEALAPAYGGDCPAAVVAHASRPHEVVLRGTLAGMPAAVREAGIERTAVVIVGEALAARHFPDSHLYSVGRSRS
ncbi:precorrin-4/cobalt-precorrin-4 C11-methyltransferase [Pseudonocardia ammonioxydans]|uniref:Precorrin-4/cobalt-precorrin-4 C11-methyltransferase n=1 Tax=Pseudonocardia ammonioxydans TaxID=260086 RepID=A0A1I5DE71_PSUAM|nr:precorrin-4 C(11)-methyltransferase [Pseudonocardia ammonioxydans]SFN97554.1 precorrin-4/cobalt-precorrin-4 C11-methyltransferase [Pseudonocardia ammonioxydans]